MHRLISILLLICLHAQPLQNTRTWVKFLLNQDYVKEFLCINKEKPQLQCNGKCYLMKQLEQNEPEQNEEDKIPLTEITKTEYIDFSKISKQSSIKKLLIPKKLYSHYRFGTYGLIEWEVFHPPPRV